MKRYGLYWLRAMTLGAGLNAVIVSQIMSNTGASFLQAVPFGTLVSVNCSFVADRYIFGARKPKTKKVEELPEISKPITTPPACPVCSDYPCACESIVA